MTDPGRGMLIELLDYLEVAQEASKWDCARVSRVQSDGQGGRQCDGDGVDGMRISIVR